MTRGRTLVELGCGTGTFGHLATSTGWTYKGFDITEAALERARLLGLDVAFGAADEDLDVAPESVDVFVMWEVIEHLWSVRDTLRTITRGLRPGGVLLLSTPNFESESYKRWIREGAPRSSPPIHLVFFDRRSLRTAARAAGFAPLAIFGYRVTRPGTMRDTWLAFRRLINRDQPVTLYAVLRKPFGSKNT
jgi:SAM-dependent methyltransferase